jgi:fatty acid synthase
MFVGREEICISGISGRFPNSRNMSEFAYNLYNGVDMVDDEETRWKHGNANVPRRMGKIGDVDKFDGGFFGSLKDNGDSTDPQIRMLLEHAYEAILDAGMSPAEIRGSRTGVFVGSTFGESNGPWITSLGSHGGFRFFGYDRALTS